MFYKKKQGPSKETSDETDSNYIGEFERKLTTKETYQKIKKK